MIRNRRSAGVSLIEVLTVVAIMAVMAAAYVSMTEPSRVSRLHSTADVLAADLQLAQEVAITRGSTYRATFAGIEREFLLEHVGTNASLNELPRYARTSTSEVATESTFSLSGRSPFGRYVWIAGFEPADLYLNDEFPVTFAANGSLLDGRTATVWLAAKDDRIVRFVPVKILAVTGVVSIGDATNALPPEAARVEAE